MLLINLYFSLVHYVWIGYNGYTSEFIGGACDGPSFFHNIVIDGKSTDQYQCVYMSIFSGIWYPHFCSTNEDNRYSLCERNMGTKSNFETLCGAGSK